jgi:hypothetical protein
MTVVAPMRGFKQVFGFCGAKIPIRVYALSRLRFLNHTQTQTLGRTPLKHVAETANCTTQSEHIRQAFMTLSGTRNHNPNSQAAAGIRPRPHGHRHRPKQILGLQNPSN